MSLKRQALSRVFILLFILNAGASFGQGELIDTSGYVPYIFSDALEYNLLIAASNGYVSEINRFIEKGADVNVETTNGVTPLIMAVASNKPEAVAALLSHDPDVNKFTSLNETPLLIAVKNNYFTIAEKLVRASADVNLADMYGATPLHYAVLYGYTDIADMLIYYDADINAKTNDGSTPLMASVWAGSYLSTELLVTNGANLEEKDSQGFTPFLLASWFGDTATMNLLYTNGANPLAIINKGHNALTLAIISGHQESVSYLLNLNKQWETGQAASDPYLVASKYGRKDLIEMLHRNNIPGKVRYQVDQFTLSLSERFAFHDALTGLSLSFKEPLLNSGFIAGCDFKPWSTRILIRNNNEEFYQYFEKGSVVYGGIFKDLELRKYANSATLNLSASLLAGYSFSNNLQGTTFTPENKFRIIPSVSLKVNYGSLNIFAGIEYIRTPFYKSGPVWFRFGTGYTNFFNNIRMRVKMPKWY